MNNCNGCSEFALPMEYLNVTEDSTVRSEDEDSSDEGLRECKFCFELLPDNEKCPCYCSDQEEDGEDVSEDDSDREPSVLVIEE